MMQKTKDIGIDAKPPQKRCDDINCAWHGKLPIRGKIIQGIVVSSKAAKTAIVRIDYQHYSPKFERYDRRHSRIAAYNPDCIEAKEGDKVKIAECKSLSKTKHFVVIEKMSV